MLTLAISGPVDRFALIKPAIVSLRGYVGATIKRTVAIRQQPKYPFQITDVAAIDGRFLKMDLKPDTTPGKSGYLLTVENIKADKGSYTDTITLKTDSKLKPELKLPVYGFVRQRPEAKKKSQTK